MSGRTMTLGGILIMCFLVTMPWWLIGLLLVLVMVAT